MKTPNQINKIEKMLKIFLQEIKKNLEKREIAIEEGKNSQK